MAGKLPQKTSGTNIATAIAGAQGSGGNWGIGAAGCGHTFSIGGGLDTITLGGSGPQPYINFSLIKAHGGTIVQCRAEDHHAWEYYIIPDNTKNFDRELGKIISMQLLKG